MNEELKDLVNKRVFIFRLLNDERYHCVNQPTDLLPADLCYLFDVEIPDHCEFMRAKVYELNVCLEFRNYGAGQIRINLYELP